MGALAVIAGLGCHQVVVLDEPPLSRSRAVILVAEGPREITLFLDAVPMSGLPNVTLRSGAPLWAFGFACEVSELGLDPRNLEPIPLEALPELPPPVETLAWTRAAGWAAADWRAAPPSIRDRFPPDGAERCSTFLPAPRFESFRVVELPFPPLLRGSPFVSAVPDGSGGIFVHQQVFALDVSDDDIDTRLLGARLLRSTAGLGLDLIEGGPTSTTAAESSLPSSAIASRGVGGLLRVGAEGIAVGDPNAGFRVLRGPIPELEGVAHVFIAESAADEPLEIFALTRKDALIVPTSSMALYRLTETETETLVPWTPEPPDRPDSIAPPSVVRTGPGEALVIGLSPPGQVLRLQNGRVEPEAFSDGEPAFAVSLLFHPRVGAVLVDRRGRLFVRRMGDDGPLEATWRLIGERATDRGLLAVGEVDGVPAVALYDGARDGGGTRLVLLRESGGPCATQAFAVRPSFFVVPVHSGDLSGAVSDAGQTWWFVDANDEGSYRVAQLVMEGPLGTCSLP